MKSRSIVWNAMRWRHALHDKTLELIEHPVTTWSIRQEPGCFSYGDREFD